MPQAASRLLRLRGAVGTVRNEMFQGREHLVVPVVALVEGVIFPVNAEAPELVLAEEIAKAPQGWNGRPVFMNHPKTDGGKVSGNDPEILEKSAFGIVFNADSSQKVFASKKLRFEAWLDRERAEGIEDAPETIERLEAGEVVEVSVGVFIIAEEREGKHDGVAYKAIWREPVPDHLALLSPGNVGACSVEMGCGTPRRARAHLITAQGIELAPEEDMLAKTTPPAGESAKPPEEKKSLRERILEKIRFRSNVEEGDLGDSDIRRILGEALAAVEPNFLGIDNVFPEQHLVVYATFSGESVALFRRGYALEGMTVTLAAEKEEVQFIGTYEPITVASAALAAASAAAPPCACTKGAEGMKTKAERIKALIDDATNQLAEADRPWLEAMPEERLALLETAQQQQPPKNPPPPPMTGPPPLQEPPKQTPKTAQTVEEYIAGAPPAMREVLSSGLAAATARRDATIKALKASGRCEYSDVELAERSQTELDRMMKLASVTVPVDFSGQGLPRVAEEKKDGVPPPPDLYGMIRTARGVAQPTTK